jgi:hypothetical protein
MQGLCFCVSSEGFRCASSLILFLYKIKCHHGRQRALFLGFDVNF